MAVREQWEIKWIQWIAVQEDWTTVVSQADTVNIVWWWTVTDVGWVATINIPEWCIWYREDVPAWAATYTFVNEPASDTSFLIFTDSGTLLFSGIDYTYDTSTHVVTFLSLWANEKAYIWVASASVQWGNVWDMVKAVYDPNNVQQNVYDYNYFINTPTVNVQAFTISSLSDLTNAQAAYDWYKDGNAPIVMYNGAEYIVKAANASNVILCSTGFTNDVDTSYTGKTQDNLIFGLTGDNVTSISQGLGGTLSMYYLSPWVDYQMPYIPQYDGSPATKKYVDDSVSNASVDSEVYTDNAIADATEDMVEWPSSSVDGNIAVFDWTTWKLIRDSWLNIQVSNNPTGTQCEIYYDNGTIYLKPIVVTEDYLWLENGDAVLTEGWDMFIMES